MSPCGWAGSGRGMICGEQSPLTPAPLPQGKRERTGGLFASLLAYPRKREAGVGIVANGGTYKNAGFPIKDVGNDRRDPCGNDRLAALPTPLLAFSHNSSGLSRPRLLSFPRFLAGIHGRAWRPRILVIENPGARLNVSRNGASGARSNVRRNNSSLSTPRIGRPSEWTFPLRASLSVRRTTSLKLGAKIRL